jgi:hypothetical protein
MTQTAMIGDLSANNARVNRFDPNNSLSLEIPMKTLICENCGFIFVKQSIWSKLADFVFPMDLILMFLMVLDCLGKRHWGASLMWMLFIAGRIYAKIERNKITKDKDVVCGRECPSCGDRSTDIKSPLGVQLIAHWATPLGKADETEEMLQDVAADEQASDERAPDEHSTATSDSVLRR